MASYATDGTPGREGGVRDNVFRAPLDGRVRISSAGATPRR